MSRIEDSLHVAQHLSAGSMSIPANTIRDDAVAADANLSASKLEHQHHFTYSQDGTAATATVPLAVVRSQNGGTVIEVMAVLKTANTGDATVNVDLQVGGTSLLASPIQFSSSDAGGTVKKGTLDSSKVSRNQNDVLDVVVTANAGTGTLGQDLLVMVVLREGAD